ncbi:MAG TPA: FAD-dependent oxidoreductase [Ktedonobacteraceae bacterium]|jgi:4-methylaminobutanoate oxidase (formaldehyde-forming)|nr:FAD-dependent oxidoreductase [Ktedonobacteraceae bacterium]
MQDQARVVIIGSGIAGSSIAYHLTEKGWRDVVVLEQGPFISGTTSHAPGLVGQLRSSVSLTKMLVYSISLYKQLAVDGQPGYFGVGSLRLASSKERMEELKRQVGFSKSVGLEAELISASEAKRMFPLMRLEGVEGALWLPTDGSAKAPILAQALANKARERGAQFYEYTRVTGIDVKNGRVEAVQTNQGRIRTEIVVVAAGIWSPRIGRMVGVSIPLIPMQHQYAVTEPLPELTGDTVIPNLRDPDKLVYFRQDGERLVIGGYERNPVAFDVDAIPDSDNPTVHPFDPARFESLMQGSIERIPALEHIELAKRVNGLESFTPDGEFILGESPDVKGFWAACGFCAHGVSGSGAVGKMIAEWIVDGEPSLDLWHMDIRRFGAYTASRRYISTRVHEVYSTYYDISYPALERSSARKLRLSPVYNRLEELGAVFGEKAGWERPNWFARNEPLAEGQDWPVPYGWASRYWSPAIGAEHQATRERVALFDETSFSKIEVFGPGSLVFLQRITDNQMDQPVGAVTYTQMLNQHGGIECDLTVTRLAADRFQIITGTAFGNHDLSWIRSQMPDDGSVYVNDITSSRCCIGVWGPKARELMQRVSEQDFLNEAFPYLTAQNVTIGQIPALALRVTYVGELGWEIYAPMEYGLKLWDTLWEAGQDLGVVAAGYRAIESLRLEKGYRYWSADISSEYNPYEAGLGFAVKLQKGDFNGKAALERIKAEGIRRKLCCLVVDDPAAVGLGGEPLLDGERVLGHVTSAGYGYTVRQSILYGYLPIEYATPGTRVETQMFGIRYGATVMKEPLYDPKNEKVKA